MGSFTWGALSGNKIYVAFWPNNVYIILERYLFFSVIIVGDSASTNDIVKIVYISRNNFILQVTFIGLN